MNKEEVDNLKADVAQLKLQLTELNKSVSELITVFQGAKGVLASVKWAAALGASIGGIIQLFRHWR